MALEDNAPTFALMDIIGFGTLSTSSPRWLRKEEDGYLGLKWTKTSILGSQHWMHLRNALFTSSGPAVVGKRSVSKCTATWPLEQTQQPTSLTTLAWVPSEENLLRFSVHQQSRMH
eukprot:5004917-Amphidinium_carterae.1